MNVAFTGLKRNLVRTSISKEELNQAAQARKATMDFVKGTFGTPPAKKQIVEAADNSVKLESRATLCNRLLAWMKKHI